MFEGLSATADLGEDHAAPHDPLDHHEHAPGEGPASVDPNDGGRAERAARAARRASPNRVVQSEDIGRHKHRHSPEERMRADAPYSEIDSVSC